MSTTVNHAGGTFGRWTVIARAVNDRYGSAHWVCRCACGKQRSVRALSLRRGISKSCGCLAREIALTQRGPQSPGWRGGRTKSSSGYVLVQAPGHPEAQKTGYVPEHRLLMEKKLGRYLRPEETVHHVNGIRTDNRHENLELWTSRQPKGQRVADLIAWAKDILNLYGGLQ